MTRLTRLGLDLGLRTLRCRKSPPTCIGRRRWPGDRGAPAGNVRWEINVTPDGTGAVAIVLPATTHCDAAGAVCTDDGRMLSNRLEVTVPGS